MHEGTDTGFKIGERMNLEKPRLTKTYSSMWSEINIPIMMLNKWIEKGKKEKSTEAN